MDTQQHKPMPGDATTLYANVVEARGNLKVAQMTEDAQYTHLADRHIAFIDGHISASALQAASAAFVGAHAAVERARTAEFQALCEWTAAIDAAVITAENTEGER